MSDSNRAPRVLKWALIGTATLCAAGGLALFCGGSIATPAMDAGTADTQDRAEAAVPDVAPFADAPWVPPRLDAGVDAGVRSPCRGCVGAPDDGGTGCANELSACRADPQCQGVYACEVAAGCFSASTRQVFIACGSACIADAGIVSSSSSSARLAQALEGCAIGPCGGVCGAAE